jgi:proteic killer suppression protein
VIRSFADKRTESIYLRQSDKRLPTETQQAALRKLRMLCNAKWIQDLRSPPGKRLEKLKSDRAGQYSMCINDEWRVCFEWRSDDAYGVEITDCH